MRQWPISPSSNGALQVMQGLIGLMGRREFESALLGHLQPVVPAASYSIYQTGSGCTPELFMSGSLGVPDTTRSCWNAYLSGPYLSDRTLVTSAVPAGETVLCHITAAEVPARHRACVYEAHGVAERVSVVQQREASVLAMNFYRHEHQRPFSDAELAGFEALSQALLGLAQKQIELCGPASRQGRPSLSGWAEKLRQREPALTPRELDVCARLLTGMTQHGIALDLGLGLPTIKTYRNRAFARLGIHFRSQLFALLAEPGGLPAGH